MFVPPRASSPRKRSASHSTDDHAPARNSSRRLYQRHAHDLDLSSHSLIFTSSLHDDLPTPSAPAHAIHSTSAYSTPMTSPSTGYSLFPGSISSATSESAPSTGYRSEFGLLMSPSPVHGSPSSRSSRHISPRSRSTTESDAHLPPSYLPPKCPSRHSSSRPSTAPHTPSTLTLASNVVDKPSDHHRRSHSRFTTSIKNLLSRPATPSFSRFASVTAPWDNNASSRSSPATPATGKHVIAPRKPRPPNLQVPGCLAAADTPSPSLAPSSPMDSHRRYASEAVAKIYNVRADTVVPTSQDSLKFSARNVTPVTPRGRESKTRNVLRRRPSGSAKLLRGTERGMSVSSRAQQGDADPPPLSPNQGTPRSTQVPLTPAGAVVEAYKQQELHRDDTLSPPNRSIDARMSPRASHLSGYDRDHSEHSPSPYSFTVGSPEHCVQAGGLGDQWGDVLETNPRTASRTMSSHQPSASDPSSRGIVRKVSSRWRKGKGGGVTSEELPACEKRHSKGRPSLHEIWTNDKSGTRAKGRSMDGVPNTGDGVWSSPTEGHSRPESDKATGSEGGKLWRLMRRISTGGLRDRLHSDNKAVPPVPAIPKELLEKVNQGEHDNEPVLTPPYQPSSLHDRDHPPLSTTPNNIAARTAIGSSSSNSSDVASISFFHKIHSPRSSISSYGEGLSTSRAPEIALERRIIAPIEQLRLDEDHVESGKVPRSPRRSASVPAGLRKPDAEADHTATPLPSPRRLTTCSGESPSRASSRPSSTSVCASGSLHASYQSHGVGTGPPRMADGILSLSPPPRPARSSKRTESATSSPHSVLVKQTDGGIGIGPGGARQMDRIPSARSDVTARPSSESPELRRSGDQGTSPPTRAQLTFRELGTPRRPPLSEQERVDIWNDLLDRSDKAGGTLHMNGAEELMSDNMRFSTHSEAL